MGSRFRRERMVDCPTYSHCSAVYEGDGLPLARPASYLHLSAPSPLYPLLMTQARSAISLDFYTHLFHLPHTSCLSPVHQTLQFTRYCISCSSGNSLRQSLVLEKILGLHLSRLLTSLRFRGSSTLLGSHVLLNIP